MKKRFHTFKGYASSYNIQTLNSFNPELQLNPLRPGVAFLDSLKTSETLKVGNT